MNLSANSLFHFTNNINIIESILQDKFYGGYCKEVLYHKNEKIPLFIPMISFCDTRLETITRFSNYGEYGIGLNKEWGIKNKLNPVFYLEKESLVAESLIKSFFGGFASIMQDQAKITQIRQKIKQVTFLKQRDANSKQQILNKLNEDLRLLKIKAAPLEHLIYSLYYTKHYQADLERESGTIKDYRFYDEREWRYMPEFECAVCQLRRTEREYLEWRGNSKNKPLLPEVSLPFDFSDIEHIIVKSQNEVEYMINIIMNLNIVKSDKNIKERLLTKVASFERITMDY